MKNKNNNTLIITGAGLIALGIIFISATMNRWLSYSFIVAGVILEIIRLLSSIRYLKLGHMGVESYDTE